MPTNERNVPRRFYFEGSALTNWGVIGADDVGGVVFRDLDVCDHLISVSAQLKDGSGFALETQSELMVFWLRRETDRLLRDANGRDAVLWRELLEARTQSLMGGVQYSNTIPRDITADNFGRGWEVPADWTSVAERDDPEPPVVYVLFRTLTATPYEFNANITYKKGDGC